MKNTTLVLATLLLMPIGLRSEEGYRIRYENPSGQMSLTVSHDIVVRRSEPIEAHRDFSFELSLATNPAVPVVAVTIDRASATSEAHDTKQRLGTRHLKGKSTSLSIVGDGKQLVPSEPSDLLAVDLGAVVTPGFSVESVLCDVLPTLPEQPVSVGAAWTTKRPVRTLEGWAWTVGELTSQHRVTAIDVEDSLVVVTVATEAEASLGAVEGGPSHSGDLQRNLLWTFDATEGRLLSLSMEQETEGTSTVPQGEISLHQSTRVELVPTT